MTEKQGSQNLSGAIRAAANAKGEMPGNCRNCTDKIGLAILPVCFAPAPNYMTTWLASDPLASAEVTRLGAALNAVDETATWYYMRTLQTGYLYIYKPDNTWDAYVVGVDGMLNRTPVDALPDSPDGELLTKCRREGHSNLKPRFITLDATLDKVWIAFSQHRWSKEVRQRYESNAEGCRMLRMTELDVAAAARGDVGTGKTVGFGMRVTDDSLRGVADFTSPEFQKRLHEFSPRAVLDLSALRAALATEMAVASSGVPSKQGVVLVIPDPVGLADDHNALRFMAQQRYDEWKAGGATVEGTGVDRLRGWKRQSATHVTYIEAWVHQRAEWEGKQTADTLRVAGEKMHTQGVGLLTESDFQRRYGRYINQPLKNERGLNVYHRARWVPFSDAVSGKPRMTVSKFSETLEPRDYDPNWKSERLGSLQLSDEYYAANANYHGGIRAERKLSRYRERLDVSALGAFNSLYTTQENAWQSTIKKIDDDLVKFARGTWPEIIFANDFGVGFSPGKPKDGIQVAQSVIDAVARLRAAESLYGGGAVSESSYKLLNELFELDPSDPKNWFAGALLTGFDLLGSAVSPGNAGTVYSAIVGGGMLPTSWWQQFRTYQQCAVTAAESLVTGMQQVANEGKTRALKASAGKGGAAAAAAIEQISQREIVWVRAAALWDFIDTEKQHYSVNVKMKVGEYLDAIAAGNPASAGTFEMRGRKVGDRTASRQANASSKKVLEKLSRHPGFQAEITVPLIVEKELLAKVKGKQGTIQLYNIGQAQGFVELPTDVASRLVKGNSIYRPRAWGAFVNREVGFSMLGAVLSVRQFWDAIQKIGMTSGFNFADAAVNVVGGISGTVGGMLEIGAFAFQMAGRQAAPVGASVLAVNVNRALMLRFLAGMSAGVGACMSGISAYISAIRTQSKGEIAASHNYVVAGTLLLVSGFAVMGGSFLTWKAAVAARVGQQVALRILGGVALRSSLGALLGASLTGIGVVLLIIGIAWALYAASLEHDENEKFLDRSFFGKHERTEGRFGGPPMVDEDVWSGQGVNDEMLALGALALGISAVIDNWEDNIFSKDVILATITVGNFKPAEQEVHYRLEGYEAMPNLAVERVMSGVDFGSSAIAPLVFQQDEENGAVQLASIRQAVPDKFSVVRLIYSLHEKGGEEPIARGEVWETD